ncbi:response regulator [Shewanella sp. A32]|uniref:HD domain-containing phosphohydrolase n=1 Tax=Shewanella sp. A32 TaxID=3031327 RepID=UPI0023B9D7CD|nr:HD domain-containing phosphohydrolase [Shewanella sp. A32]MDF0533955.1 response regulator [Shewanella sp. A32]
MIALAKETPATILCVDDEPSILKSLQRLFLGQPCEVLLASSGEEALALMQDRAVEVIICDMRMPQMSGAEFLQQATQLQPNAYRMLMTGYADLASTIAAVNIGRIHRYIQKPWDNNELLKAVDEGLEYYRLLLTNRQLTAQVEQQNTRLKQLNQSLEEQVQQRTQQLRQSLQQLKSLLIQREKESDAILQLLYNIISIHPRLSGDYARRVSQTCHDLAKALGCSNTQQQLISHAGLYSEVGKLGFNSGLLDKPFHALGANDARRYLFHPQLAEEIMAPAVHLQPMVEIILHQYEHYNGDGVPDGLKAQEIPVGSRILAVARDFWALIYKRLSENVHSHAEAIAWLKRQQGSVYDPQLIAIMEQLQQRQQLNKPEVDDVQGATIEQLQPGMQLSHNLYNRNQMLLLPQGHVLTQQSLDKLREYQAKHKTVLRLQLEVTDKSNSPTA